MTLNNQIFLKRAKLGLTKLASNHCGGATHLWWGLQALLISLHWTKSVWVELNEAKTQGKFGLTCRTKIDIHFTGNTRNWRLGQKKFSDDAATVQCVSSGGIHWGIGRSSRTLSTGVNSTTCAWLAANQKKRVVDFQESGAFNDPRGGRLEIALTSRYTFVDGRGVALAKHAIAIARR